MCLNMLNVFVSMYSMLTRRAVQMQHIVFTEALNKQHFRPLPDYNTTWPQPGCKAGPGPWGSGAATAVDGSAASHMPQPEVVPTRSTHSSREAARAGSGVRTHAKGGLALQSRPASQACRHCREFNQSLVASIEQVHGGTCPAPFCLGPRYISRQKETQQNIYTFI